MTRRSYIPFIVTAGVLFTAGLTLGAGKSSDDTSVTNTASKLLLAIGLLALVATTVLELVSRARARRATTDGRTREITTTPAKRPSS